MLSSGILGLNSFPTFRDTSIGSSIPTELLSLIEQEVLRIDSMVVSRAMELYSNLVATFWAGRRSLTKMVDENNFDFTSLHDLRAITIALRQAIEHEVKNLENVSSLIIALINSKQISLLEYLRPPHVSKRFSETLYSMIEDDLLRNELDPDTFDNGNDGESDTNEKRMEEYERMENALRVYDLITLTPSGLERPRFYYYFSQLENLWDVIGSEPEKAHKFLMTKILAQRIHNELMSEWMDLEYEKKSGISNLDETNWGPEEKHQDIQKFSPEYRRWFPETLQEFAAKEGKRV
jgi:hypothetical protein